MYLPLVYHLLRLVFFILVHHENMLQKEIFCCCFCDLQSFQENGRVSLVLPGSLMKFDEEIKEIIRIEKARFLANQRFSQIFANIELGHVFANNANLKKIAHHRKAQNTSFLWHSFLLN